MSEQKHTPEPWKWVKHHGDGYFSNKMGLINENNEEICNFGNCETYYPTDGVEPSDANAQRIVDCVNAMQGIENPIGWKLEIKVLLVGAMIAKNEEVKNNMIQQALDLFPKQESEDK